MAGCGGTWWPGTAGCAPSWVPLAEVPGAGAVAGEPGALQRVPAGTVPRSLLSEESVAGIPSAPQRLCLGPRAHARGSCGVPIPGCWLPFHPPAAARAAVAPARSSASVAPAAARPPPHPPGHAQGGWGAVGTGTAAGGWRHRLCHCSGRWGLPGHGDCPHTAQRCSRRPAPPGRGEAQGAPLMAPPGLGLGRLPPAPSAARWPCLHGFLSHFCTLVP